MSMMKMVGDQVERMYDWFVNETDKTKACCKAFVAGFVDGWLYTTMLIGNIVCLIGLIKSIIGIKNRITKD